MTSTTQPLTLDLEEPGDDPICDQAMEILRKVLQPESETPLEVAVERIVALLPNGQPYASEVGRVLETCYEAAEQIPYSHPSMARLVTIVFSFLNSDALQKPSDSEHSFRYQRLSETMRDWWNSSKPDEDPVKFVNFQTFAARIFERGMLKGAILSIGTIERALENVKKHTSQERNAFVKAASQWLLLQGDVVYAEVTDGRLSQKKWRGWHERLSAVAAGEAESRNVSYDPEAIELAGKAIVAMEALERQKAG